MFSAGIAAALVVPTAVAVEPSIRHVSGTPYALTSVVDSFTDSWATLFANTEASVTDIWDHVAVAPFPVVQQFIANVAGYVEGVFSDPSSILDIPGAIFNNAVGAFEGVVAPFDPVNPALYASLDETPMLLTVKSDLWQSLFGSNVVFTDELPGHLGMMQLLVGGYPLDTDAMNVLNWSWGDHTVGDEINTYYPGLIGLDSDPYTFNAMNMLIANETLRYMAQLMLGFNGSSLSGVLFGAFTTVSSPFLQIGAEVESLFTNLFGGEWEDALSVLLNSPANVIDAFLNGYGDLDLSGVIGGDDFNINMAFGGLLSGGGSAFNALGIDATMGDCAYACATVDMPAVAVGPIAALVQMAQAVASGMGWSEFGNPLDGAFDGLIGSLDGLFDGLF